MKVTGGCRRLRLPGNVAQVLENVFVVVECATQRLPLPLHFLQQTCRLCAAIQRFAHLLQTHVLPKYAAHDNTQSNQQGGCARGAHPRRTVCTEGTRGPEGTSRREGGEGFGGRRWLLAARASRGHIGNARRVACIASVRVRHACLVDGAILQRIRFVLARDRAIRRS